MEINKPNLSSVLMIFCFGVLTYINVLNNSFVWDDEQQVLNNTQIRSLKNIPNFFKGSTFFGGGAKTQTGTYYRPLMTTSYALLFSAFGASAFYYHLFQVFLCIINAILVYLFFLYFFKEITSLLISTIFLIHPLNSEVVQYVANFQDVLFFFFGMVAILIYLSSFKNFHIRHIIFTSIFLFFSLLSKESGILFVAVIIYHNLIFRDTKQKMFASALGIFIVFAIYFYLRLIVADLSHSSGLLATISRAPIGTRLMSLPKVWYFYLQNFALPWPLSISAHWVVTSFNVFDFFVPLLCLLVLIVLFILSLKTTKSKSTLFFILWFITGMGLHSQLVPLDMTVADRWFYFPAVGLIGFIATIWEYKRIRLGRVKYIFMCTLLMTLSIRTIIRNINWKDGLTLYSRDIKYSPNSFDLQNNLGTELFRKDKLNLACQHFQESVKLAPYWWTNWNNLGVCYQRQNKLKVAQMMYERAIVNGHYYLAYENKVSILIKQKKFNEALSFLKLTALKYFPYNKNLQDMYKKLQ